jgi:SPP1 gp7 family putative phage head morphogenesis protein
VTWKILTDDVAFKEALAALRKRVPITDEAFRDIIVASHDRSFVISNVNSLDLVTQVWESLKAAIQGDIEFRDFKKTIGSQLIEAWGIPSKKVASHRVATTFRNAVQTSFNHGRWQQLEDPDLKQLRPYRMFDSIRDGRTTKVCKDCNGTILEADDPWWDSHVPPLHHACRSHVRSLRASAAKRKGITSSPTPAKPQKGFGDRPSGATPSMKEVEPDLTQYPAELARIYKAKTSNR